MFLSSAILGHMSERPRALENTAINKDHLLKIFEIWIELMVLSGQNTFKIRAIEKGMGILEALDWTELKTRVSDESLTEIPGIGKGIAAAVSEFFVCGQVKEVQDLDRSVPAVLRDVAGLSGLGPKKARALVEDLKLTSLEDLEKACLEHRLVDLKGFGEKTEAKILKEIEFKKSNGKRVRLSSVMDLSDQVAAELETELNREHHPAAGRLRVVVAGEVRRRLEIVSSIEFLVELPLGQKAGDAVKARLNEFALQQSKAWDFGVPVALHFSITSQFAKDLIRFTGPSDHLSDLNKLGLNLNGEGDGKSKSDEGRTDAAKGDSAGRDEAFYYQSVGLAWVSPEMRDSSDVVTLAKKMDKLPRLELADLKGTFHAHSTASDGTASLRDMVLAAKDLGLSYFGISDHSQSAFYANGLKVNDLKAQRKEIDELQREFKGFRIFWGIESDILVDGALDYPDEVLSEFDFVIGSIHSRFQHDKETMTARILKAIENPYITMVGHLTGRLLLDREAYGLDIPAIIDSCAKHDVMIELNSNPQRLDIDWRWGSLLREKKCRVSINPDAHSIQGLQDIRYGILMARKAMLPHELIFNTQSVEQIEAWFRERKERAKRA
jgi:DNA polymerase (family 10)